MVRPLFSDLTDVDGIDQSKKLLLTHEFPISAPK